VRERGQAHENVYVLVSHINVLVSHINVLVSHINVLVSHINVLVSHINVLVSHINAPGACACIQAVLLTFVSAVVEAYEHLLWNVGQVLQQCAVVGEVAVAPRGEGDE